MNPEAEQSAPKTESKRRAGVPVWRTGKPDAFLATAVDVARNALEGITAASDIGEHLAARSEGDRLVTHLFESKLPGYPGWQWYAVLTRNSRSKVVTVNELGLLPSEDSILAPEWVPWAERVRPEDAQDQEPAAESAADAGTAEDAGTGEGTGTAEDTAEPSGIADSDDDDSGPDDDGESGDAPSDDPDAPTNHPAGEAD